MVGIVRDRAGVPERRMAPGAFPDNESRLGCVGVHAATPALLDDCHVALDVAVMRRRAEQVERFCGACNEIGASYDADAAAHCAPAAQFVESADEPSQRLKNYI